jgi:hypothetical protein
MIAPRLDPFGQIAQQRHFRTAIAVEVIDEMKDALRHCNSAPDWAKFHKSFMRFGGKSEIA